MKPSFDIKNLVRSNVLNMAPYSSARDEFKGKAGIYLDANENSLGSVVGDGYNRYPDPLQTTLRKKVAKLKGVEPEQLFFGNGSDEAIDLLFRVFCSPKTDRVIILTPTYGMYKVQADINETPCDEVSLNPDFSLPVQRILDSVKPETKLIFICSPNNPTGNLMEREKVYQILNEFNGLVVVDEAYIDFADSPSLISEIRNYPNLVVLQTFSKAWGMAALRLGMAFAGKEIIQMMNKIKYPYNVNSATQELALKALEQTELKDKLVNEILNQRAWLTKQLKSIPAVQTVYPSDANFLLVKIQQATQIYQNLIEQGIVVRNRSNVALCENCLRITVGTKEENELLINYLKNNPVRV